MPRSDPLEVWNVEVVATSVRISLNAEAADTFADSAEPRTWVSIDGRLDRPVKRTLTTVNILAYRGEALEGGNPGYAIGGSRDWLIVTPLPEREFGDLLLLASLQCLETVRLVTEKIRYGKGAVHSVSFATRPVPSDVDDC